MGRVKDKKPDIDQSARFIEAKNKDTHG